MKLRNYYICLMRIYSKDNRIKPVILELSPLFPKVKRLIVVLVRTKSFYMAINRVLNPLFSILFIDKSCYKMPDKAIRALIAHELSHVQYPYLSEREVDLNLIQLGFKDELICFHKFHNKKYKKYKKKDGLTLKEILLLSQ